MAANRPRGAAEWSATAGSDTSDIFVRLNGRADETMCGEPRRLWRASKGGLTVSCDMCSTIPHPQYARIDRQDDPTSISGGLLLLGQLFGSV